MAALRTLDDLSVAHQRVLVRADLNVPLSDVDGAVSVLDDTRIRAALETIEELRARHARIVLLSHLGRPQGRDPGLSMSPIAERLNELLGGGVSLAPGVVGDDITALTRHLRAGDVLLLENVRYEPGETENDPELALALAQLADVFVNDAFGTAHRAHASTVGVAGLLPSAAGRLMEREVSTLSALVERPVRPLVAVLGGAKVADKIALVERFLQIADAVLIGGAMSLPFLAEQGHTLGASPCDDADRELARGALARAAQEGRELQLPEDLVVADRASEHADAHLTDRADVPEGLLGLDIGPRSAAHFANTIERAGTVFWNGPMGVFECEPFAGGTREVAHAVALTSGLSVVGGGETVAAVRRLGLADRVDHLSTGGGATLRLLQGLALPAVEALRVGDGSADRRSSQPASLAARG